MLRTRLFWLVVHVLVLALPRPGAAYKFIDFVNPDGETVFLKWGPENVPVGWHFSQTRPRNFSLEEAILSTQASFNTWEDIPTADITFQFAGTTSAEPFVFFDFINTLGFITDPDLEGTGILGATNFIVFTQTGEIAESDIFFNDDVRWSVSTNGTPGRFDYQGTATHEIGHFLGLDHSGLGIVETNNGGRTVIEGTALMYPFAFAPGTIIGRGLTADDIAGASAIYPTGGFQQSTGTLSGRVTKNGQAVAAAHVVTFNPFTEETISIFTDESGTFRVEGLSLGPHTVRVNPITDPTSPENFSFSEEMVDLDFRDTFFDGRAEVRAASTTSGVEVEVQP